MKGVDSQAFGDVFGYAYIGIVVASHVVEAIKNHKSPEEATDAILELVHPMIVAAIKKGQDANRSGEGGNS